MIQCRWPTHALLVGLGLVGGLMACSASGEPERASLADQPEPDVGAVVVGAPLSNDEREDAYTVVLRELSGRLQQWYPALHPVVCLNRGIQTGPGGAYVEDHAQDWIDSAIEDGLVEAVGDRSTAGCPGQSYFVTLLLTQLLAGDSVAVPLTAQPVLRGTGGQVDARNWSAILTGRGSRWVVAEWR
jgi:hypothetical protein